MLDEKSPLLPRLQQEAGIHPASGRGNLQGVEWGGLKKRGLGARSWIRIDNRGHVQVLEVDKVTIMRKCELPARDLRLLDPLFVYPAMILGREKAIVVNLEQIRCIITAEETLLLNSLDNYVLQYVNELQRRVTANCDMDVQGFKWRSPQTWTANNEDSRVHKLVDLAGLYHTEKFNDYSPSSLPFEFKALEVALEAASSFLDTQAAELEEEAYPLLDELASKISTLNLERVRRLKSRLVGLSTRVQKVRDEIEQLMDDDEDMAEMYLSEKKERMDAAYQKDQVFQSQTSFGAGRSVSAPVSPTCSPENSRALEKALSFGKNRLQSRSSSESGVEQVEELEMLLEAYFVVIDGTLNKLYSLKEYISDTEDLINIQLDNVRNQLIQIELLLTSATFVIGIFGVVAGVFGMNIQIALFDQPWAFKWILIISGMTGLCMFFLFVLFFRWRGLMSF
ncbi:hypothetical protein O6H91_17G018000 [Diphasiastrum complanatum]|uniref:Uncharacterized protein n=4 Tax=Diphasiastrum complanatum TaxID=34168 RepID=A0ACC2B4K8_DIPCM|nr:hypothetical protein O6H91_17G018000 [Diphasiastrum complanatum]KAJ7524717.1 hypothetical protein O6H91_17G018000 [Diphasiastrum complanatum]KAJ7524718.1 hypothetical protein O6H91_17G018000 [Diphasiastrum complanatum]KAJ7524719.1 hypothetical protein O6H91_17G018000 [Diphasiastrum complanatum]